MLFAQLGADASYEEAIRAYRKHQVVLIKDVVRSVNGGAAALRHEEFMERHAGQLRTKALDESEATKGSGCWYRSALVSGDELPAAYSELQALMPRELHSTRLAFHNCFWIFWGCNNSLAPLPGRPEHVDEVEAMGTIHWQASGAKTWRFRTAAGGRWPAGSLAPPNDLVFQVECEQGSLLMVNTRLLLHHTQVPPDRGEMSLSYAREFDLIDGRRLLEHARELPLPLHFRHPHPTSDEECEHQTPSPCAKIEHSAGAGAGGGGGADRPSQTQLEVEGTDDGKGCAAFLLLERASGCGCRETAAVPGALVLQGNVISRRSVCALCGTPTGLDFASPSRLGYVGRACSTCVCRVVCRES
jgi:hypothetical protein